ncbi:MAG: leucine-rich repeat protein, partial [Treponema sp.]|nr:leucine-rich repeat protein [Treponema sp.]
MKKKIFFFVAALFLFFSCKNILNRPDNSSEDNQTYLIISSASIKESVQKLNRTIEQTKVSNLTDFVLTGKLSTEETMHSMIEADDFNALSDVKITITPGEWDFKLTAKIGEINFEGTTKAVIQEGKINSISFVLASDKGYGGISIKMNFTGDADKVVVNVLSKDKQTQIDSKTFLAANDDFVEDAESDDNSKYFTYNLETILNSNDEEIPLPAATYFIIFDFYNTSLSEYGDGSADSNPLPLNSSKNYVRVGNGITTEAELNIVLNDVYTITYVKNGGEIVTGQTLRENYSRKSSFVLPKMENDGKIFVGWYTTDPSSADFDPSTRKTKIEKSAGDLTLYARYSTDAVLYVNAEGSIDNDGLTPDTAMLDITQAVQKIIEYDTPKDWIIEVEGKVYGPQSIGLYNSDDDKYTYLTTDHAKSLKIQGTSNTTEILTARPNDVANSWNGTVLSIYAPPVVSAGNSGAANGTGADVQDKVVPVTLDKLTITDGKGENGGGIKLCSNATLILGEDVCVTGNSATNGGGVYVASGSVLSVAGADSVTENTGADNVESNYYFAGDVGFIDNSVLGLLTAGESYNFVGGKELTDNALTVFFQKLFTVGDGTNKLFGNLTLDLSRALEVTKMDLPSVSGTGENAILNNDFTTLTLPPNLVKVNTDENTNKIINKVTEISIAETNSNYCTQDGVLYNKAKTELVWYPAEKTNSKDSDGDGELDTFEIPQTVNSIADYAFYENQKLKTINIPSTVTAIGKSAFTGSKLLEEVNMNEGLQVLNKSVFASCNKFKKVTLPASIDTIDNRAFYFDNALEEIIYSGTRAQWKAIEIKEASKMFEWNYRVPAEVTCSDGTVYVHEYKITYNLNDDEDNPATNAASNKTTYTGEDVLVGSVEFAAPTRTGYAFNGWYTKENFSDDEPITEISAIIELDDYTLYAKWSRANGITVSINQKNDLGLEVTQVNEITKTVTFGVTGGNSNATYSWYVDGVKQTGSNSTGSTFALTPTSAGTKTYVVEVRCGLYSASATVNIETKADLYVSASADPDDDSADGTEEHPFATIQAACNAMTSSIIDEYTIYVDGLLQSADKIPNTVSENIKSITIAGKNALVDGVPQDGIKFATKGYGNCLEVLTDVPVIIKNLYLRDGVYGIGVGNSLSNANAAVDVTLESGTLIDGNEYGVKICGNCSVRVKDSVTITNNASSENSGIYVSQNAKLYLEGGTFSGNTSVFGYDIDINYLNGAKVYISSVLPDVNQFAAFFSSAIASGSIQSGTQLIYNDGLSDEEFAAQCAKFKVVKPGDTTVWIINSEGCLVRGINVG